MHGRRPCQRGLHSTNGRGAQAEVFQESLKGLSLQDKHDKISSAIAEIETKKKKKIATIIHEDTKAIYDEFCNESGKKANSEICNQMELQAYLSSPLPGKGTGA